MKAVSEELRLRTNASKTKVMVIDLAGCLPESDVLREYEKADTLVYFSSAIEANSRSSADIWHRIVLGKTSMTRLWNVTCN